jgi:hypothetical protein
VLICLYLRLKKEKVLTADDKVLTPMHAEFENRVRAGFRDCELLANIVGKTRP